VLYTYIVIYHNNLMYIGTVDFIRRWLMMFMVINVEYYLITTNTVSEQHSAYCLSVKKKQFHCYVYNTNYNISRKYFYDPYCVKKLRLKKTPHGAEFFIITYQVLYYSVFLMASSSVFRISFRVT